MRRTRRCTGTGSPANTFNKASGGPVEELQLSVTLFLFIETAETGSGTLTSLSPTWSLPALSESVR